MSRKKNMSQACSILIIPEHMFYFNLVWCFPMKTVLLLRHAKSSWNHPELNDRERPLNKRGKRQAPEMGKLIYTENLTPDLILSSPARRACKTAEAVAKNCGYDGEIDQIDDFYPGEPVDYLRVLSELPDGARRVMVVGHNPGLEEFLRVLIGETRPFSTAALAQVDLPLESWHELTAATHGTLVRILHPPEKEK
jgi:phosphohistidine phosphatase